MSKGKSRYIIDTHGLNLLQQLLEAEKEEYDNDGSGYHQEVSRLKGLLVAWYMERRKCTKNQAESGVIMLTDLFYHFKD